MERKLAALLSADAKDYSVLVSKDDEGTLVTLKACREIMTRLIDEHRGRVVDAPGDNLLAEFASAVDALRAAVAIQHELAALNATLANLRRLQFRIGITIGDVVVDDGRLYGDGVNIAARLENLAEPGGICISGNVREQVANRLDVLFESMGEQQVKNIAQPIVVWRVRSRTTSGLDDSGAGVRSSGSPVSAAPAPARPGQRMFILTALFALVIAGSYIWWTSRTDMPADAPRVPAAQDAAGTVLPLPDVPSLVVLPFVNLSGDPAQDYLSDGITEDLTTDLAKLAGLFVISRSTASTFKGKRIPLPDIGREIGVRYVVEGSVLRAEQRLRVTAQLIDTRGDTHLWAERYDRPATDIFAVQDEIRRRIVTALKVKLSPEEQTRFQRAPTENLEAYDLYLQAKDTFGEARRILDRALVDRARDLLRQAIALDENYAAAYGALGLIDWVEWVYDWNTSANAPSEIVTAYAERALAIDPATPGIRRMLVGILTLEGKWDDALTQAEREVELHPSDGEAWRSLGGALALAGRRTDAVAAMDRALRLNPRYPPHWAWQIGLAYRYGGRTADALRVLEDATRRAPNMLSNHMVLAAIHAEDGQFNEARASVAAIRRISPTFTAEHARRRLAFKDPEITEAYVSALRSAGLP